MNREIEQDGRSMRIIRVLKFRIYPSEEQVKQIETTLSCCRYVYNKMLERSSKAYTRRGEHASYLSMQQLLPHMKQYLPWLKEADGTALRYACRQLDGAYLKFFKGQNRYPRFKSKRNTRQSYTTTNVRTIRYETGRVKLTKLGWVKHPDNRELRGTICFATVIRDGDKYYVSVTYKYEKEVQFVKPKNCIGLDYKSNGLYEDSEGDIANMPRWFRLSEEKVAKEQRKLSKKKGSNKGERRSNNYLKQLNRLRKKYRHIANQRRDYLHKKSTEIANQYDLVAVEDLNLNAISQTLRLGKSTLDNGYGMFLYMLEYKLAERGKHFVKVDRRFPSSQLCSCCGYKNPAVKDLKVREWVCPECGVVHDRDHNAAVNILNEGLKKIS